MNEDGMDTTRSPTRHDYAKYGGVVGSSLLMGRVDRERAAAIAGGVGER